MKKVLLGTTALVAAGFVASAATADEMMAEPVSVGVGGYYRVAIGNVDGSDGMGEPEQNNHRTAFGEDTELNIGGSTTLDNGMSVGVSINLEASRGGNAGAGADEAHVFFEGAFGRIQMGNIESARQQKVTFAPQGTSNFGVNTPFFTFAAGSWLATYDDGLGNEDSMKLVYTTPSFNGFQLGLSYAPDDNTHGQYGGNTSADAGQYENQFGAGLSFAQDFAGGSLSMSAGYETYDAEIPDGTSCMDTVYDTAMYTVADKIAAITMAADSNGDGDILDTGEAAEAARLADIAWTEGDNEGDNPLTGAAVGAGTGLSTANAASGRTYTFADPGSAGPRAANCSPETLNFGATIGFGAFSVGGGWMQRDVTDNTSYTAMDFGVSWSDGPMTLGAVYGSSETEATGGDASVERFALNGTYALGPGVDIQAQLDFGESDAAGPPNAAMDNDWVQFMIGSAVTF